MLEADGRIAKWDQRVNRLRSTYVDSGGVRSGGRSSAITRNFYEGHSATSAQAHGQVARGASGQRRRRPDRLAPVAFIPILARLVQSLPACTNLADILCRPAAHCPNATDEINTSH